MAAKKQQRQLSDRRQVGWKMSEKARPYYISHTRKPTGTTGSHASTVRNVITANTVLVAWNLFKLGASAIADAGFVLAARNQSN